MKKCIISDPVLSFQLRSGSVYHSRLNSVTDHGYGLKTALPLGKRDSALGTTECGPAGDGDWLMNKRLLEGMSYEANPAKHGKQDCVAD
jgi:hypothetical protein